MSDNRLECSNITVRFGGLVALAGVRLSVPPATTVGLVGPNGAGKSTLFGVVSGLIRPATGTVLIGGEDVTHARPQVRAERGLARTFQHPKLFTGLTVRQHLQLAYRSRHAKSRVWSDLFTMGSLRREDPRETTSIDELIKVLGLEPIADRPCLGLPLGTARLVEIGRALATSPSVLLLDEPSSGLDSADTEQFEKTLARVSMDRGISVLLVEHDVELVMRMCSTVYVLDFGALIADGTPAEVRSNPAVRAAYLGEEVTGEGGEGAGGEVGGMGAGSDGEVVGGGVGGGGVGSPALVAASTPGAPGRNPGERAAGTDGSGALSVENLSVRYGEAVALAGVSLAVGTGQVLAVLGPNGAGKSSLARALSGLVRPHAGKIFFAGDEVSRWPAHRIRRAGLVHLPEGRGVLRGLSVMDNLGMAAASLEGRQARRDAINLALDMFPALASRRRQMAGSLSGGEQQMLSLARALATSPKLIIADEMSLGLAPKMVDLVFEGLARARETGASIVMIEQYVHRALDFADECLVLQRGSTVWQGPAGDAGQELLSHYLGEAMSAAS